MARRSPEAALPRWLIALLAAVAAVATGCDEAEPPHAEFWSCTCRFDLPDVLPPALGVEASDWVCGPAGWGGDAARAEAEAIARRGCSADEQALNCACQCAPLGEVCDEGVF